MSRTNSPSIIRRSPKVIHNQRTERVGRNLIKQNYSIFTIEALQQNVRTATLAVLSAFLILLSGCEDPGGVGSRFLDEDAGLETITTPLASSEAVTVDSYSGRLRYMAIGRYDDPVFGQFESIGILKPSIDTTSIGSHVSEEDLFQLRLTFSSTHYGDTTQTARYELYRLNDIWRGNELYFTDQLEMDLSERVGEFEVSGESTVSVDLAQSWIDEYNEFLASSDEDRQDQYRTGFPGLAIVPADGTTRAHFIRVRPDPGDDAEDEELARFVRVPAEDLEEWEEWDGTEEEDPRQFQPLADWGAFGAWGEPAERDEKSIYLTNPLESVLRVETGLSESVPGGRNQANAQLIFHPNRELLELPDGHVRPEVTQLRLHRVNSDRIGEWIFGRDPVLTASLNQGNDSFRFDLTGYINEILFNEPPPGQFYLSAHTVTGLVFSTVLHGEDADDETLRPKIIITSVNSDSR